MKRFEWFYKKNNNNYNDYDIEINMDGAMMPTILH